MEYKMLQPEEQLALVRVRLAEAEKAHYASGLSDDGPNGLVISRTPELEAAMMYLRSEEDRLVGLADTPSTA